jgi:protein-serine/threonine kinase
MDNSNNKGFYLNLGNSAKFPQESYPTTPSTFPNPIFPSQGQGAQQQYPQNAQQQPYSNSGFGPQGYFMNNAYSPQYGAQPQSNYQQSPAPQAPQAAYQQRAAAAPNNNDATTNGLVHQFSHQNLGGAGRQSPYGSRQPAAAQRPRTAGATGQQAGYTSYLNAPMPSQASQQQSWPEFQIAPERNPDKYGSVTQSNQKKSERLASDFFKDSVKRARDRNLRYVFLDYTFHSHSSVIGQSY